MCAHLQHAFLILFPFFVTDRASIHFVELVFPGRVSCSTPSFHLNSLAVQEIIAAKRVNE